jgi:hypothetical protein
MRDITIDAQTELESAYKRPLFLVSIEFKNETIYVWTGIGDLTWSGNTYKGVGTLGQISPIVETTETQAQGITLSLSGIPLDLLGDALDNISVAGKASVYLGFLTSSGTLVADPILAFSGLTDQPSIDMSTESAMISIAVENKLTDLNRARGGRYTDADQRARHSTDKGLQYVAWLQDMAINWRG